MLLVSGCIASDLSFPCIIDGSLILSSYSKVLDQGHSRAVASGFPKDSAIKVSGSNGVPSEWTSACDCSNGWYDASTSSSGTFAGTSYCGYGSNNKNACDSESGDGAATTPFPGSYTITFSVNHVSVSFNITIEAGNSVTNESGLFSFLSSTSPVKPGGNVVVGYYECNYVTLYSGSKVLIGGCSAQYTASGNVTGKMCGSALSIAKTSTTRPWPVSNIDVTKAAPNKVTYPVPSSCSSGEQSATLSIAKGSGRTSLTYSFEINVS